MSPPDDVLDQLRAMLKWDFAWQYDARVQDAIAEIEQLRAARPAIAAELYIALERLNAPPELLSIVGSYGDTLSDEEVLQLLKARNEP